jgi:hypothetical protein
VTPEEIRKAFVRNLVIAAICEAGLIAGGVAFYLTTGQILLLVVMVFLGAAPVVYITLNYARQMKSARDAQAGGEGGSIVQ